MRAIYFLAGVLIGLGLSELFAPQPHHALNLWIPEIPSELFSKWSIDPPPTPEELSHFKIRRTARGDKQLVKDGEACPNSFLNEDDRLRRDLEWWIRDMRAMRGPAPKWSTPQNLGTNDNDIFK